MRTVSEHREQALANLRIGIATREQNRRTKQIPQKPDPDVLAIGQTFNVLYGQAKIMKAMSFGAPVDAELIHWCSGKANRRHVCYHFERIRNVVPAFNPRMLGREKLLNPGKLFYVLECPVMIRKIRDAMNAAQVQH
jgi:hypothetical protein